MTRRARAPFRRSPLSLRANLPADGWVELAPHLETRLLDVEWDHRLPGGSAKLNAKLLGEYSLVPGTLLAVFDGSCPVWSGEIESSDPDPQSKTTSIVGRGRADTMQDGIVYDKAYVLRDATKAVPIAAQYGVKPAEFDGNHDPTMATDASGMHRIPIGQGSTLKSGVGNGFTFDAGPNNVWKYYACYVYINVVVGTATFVAYAVASPVPMNIATGTGVPSWDVVAQIPNPSPALTSLGLGGPVAGSDRRYANFYYSYSGGTTTTGADHTLTFHSFLLATNQAYVSWPNSILKVDAVAKDIVQNAGIPNVSSSIAQIAAGTTVIEELVSNGDNPRGLLERANAVDGMQWFWSADPIPALVLRSEPTSARWSPLPGEISLEGGANATSIVDVYNQVQILWTSFTGAPNSTVATLTPDTSILARVGRTRRAVIKISRKTTSTEAAAIAAAFLRARRNAPMKASVKTTVPWIRTTTGQRMPVSMLSIGDRIRLPIRDVVTGMVGREGTIYGVSVNPRTGVATISIDSDASIFDRQLAYFESRAG